MSPKLSLCMIVKNEAAHLGECLEAVRPAVDEIVVVDTGSVDGTQAVARRHQARVVEVSWQDDFSAARNESLRQAAHEYILWLDADDRVEPDELAKLSRLKAGFPLSGTQAYFTTVRSELPNGEYSLCKQLRIFPKRADVIFENRVHEQILGRVLKAGIQTRDSGIVIRHLGYAAADSLAGKALRNARILEQELAENPENPLLHYDLANALGGLQQQERALEHLDYILRDRTIKQAYPGIYMEAGLLAANHRRDIGEIRTAGKLLSDLSRQFPGEKRIALALGESLLLAGNYQETLDTLRPLLNHVWEIGFQPLSPEWQQSQVHSLLGRAYQETGRLSEARTHYARAVALQKNPGPGWEALGTVCFQLQDYSAAAENLEKAIAAGKNSEANYQRLGQAYQRLNRLPEAEKALAAAREHSAEEIGRNLENECLADLAKRPGEGEPLIRLGNLYLEKNETAKALPYLLQARALNPESLHAGAALAGLYCRRGEFDSLVQVVGAMLGCLQLPLPPLLESLDDLAKVCETMGEHLARQGENDLALSVQLLSFRIYPRASVLKKIIPLAAQGSRLEACRPQIQESLQAHAGDPSVAAWLREFTGSVPAA